MFQLTPYMFWYLHHRRLHQSHFYLQFLLILILIGYLAEFKYLYFMCFGLIVLQMYFFQLKEFNLKDPSNCLKIFKSNNFLGALVLILILIGKIN